MVKKCVYCGKILPDDSVLDVCQTCGISVWGEQMFKAIVSNMEGAREKGDLYQGSISDEKNKPAPVIEEKIKNSSETSFKDNLLNDSAELIE